MSYTPPDGNQVNSDFIAAGYAAPVGNAVDFNFIDANTPIQGVINIIGGIPTVVGGSFDVVVQPQIGLISIIGQVPLPAIPAVIPPPIQGVISITGLVPTPQYGQVLSPTTLTVNLVGGIPSELVGYTFVSALQLTHRLNAVALSPDNITYQLFLDDGTNQVSIPMLSIVLRKTFDNVSLSYKDTLTIKTAPAAYAQTIDYLGETLKMYRFVNGIGQQLAAHILTNVIGNAVETVLTSEAEGIQGTGELSLSGASYIRVINADMSIRLAPNFAVKVGSRLIVDGLTIPVNRAVIYISPEQQFMEIS